MKTYVHLRTHHSFVSYQSYYEQLQYIAWLYHNSDPQSEWMEWSFIYFDGNQLEFKITCVYISDL